MSIKFQNSNIKEIYLGGSKIKTIYQGTQKVYESTKTIRVRIRCILPFNDDKFWIDGYNASYDQDGEGYINFAINSNQSCLNLHLHLDSERDDSGWGSYSEPYLSEYNIGWSKVSGGQIRIEDDMGGSTTLSLTPPVSTLSLDNEVTKVKSSETKDVKSIALSPHSIELVCDSNDVMTLAGWDDDQDKTDDLWFNLYPKEWNSDICLRLVIT
ncbi:MAG: hypothetical protein K2G74_02150 [Muribaculaceae bacterium]|nr:hypothetical protein [Muribaculaceae bacterium]